MNVVAKTLADSYLFKKNQNYERKLLEFVQTAQRINTSSEAFADILFDVKRRRVADSVNKILVSPKTVIGVNPKGTPLPKAFAAFVMKDVKTDGQFRVFIDTTDYMKNKGGIYDCTDINWLICYAIAGMTNFIYKQVPQKLVLDGDIIEYGCGCFMRLVSYIIDRIYKTTSVQKLQRKIDYLACLYYLISILGKEIDTEAQFRTCHYMAVKVSNIEERDAVVVDAAVKQEDFKDINTIIAAYGRIFNLKDFKIDNFAEKWIMFYGTGTIFGMEYFPAFSMMLTHAYIGGYLNNQVTIEKLTGNAMISFSKAILRIGDAVS